MWLSHIGENAVPKEVLGYQILLGEYFSANNFYTDRNNLKTAKIFYVPGLYFYFENIYMLNFICVDELNQLG